MWDKFIAALRRLTGQLKKGGRPRKKGPFIPTVMPLENRWVPAPLELVGTNVDVSKMAGWEAETNIAVDPKNSANAFVVSLIPGRAEFPEGGLFTAYTTTNPGNWTTKVIATSADSLGAASTDPHAVFDEKYGYLFLVYLGRNQAQKGTASDDAGNKTFKDTKRNWIQGQWDNTVLSVTSGVANGHFRGIESNTQNTLTLSENWSTQPKKDDSYSVLLTVSVTTGQAAAGSGNTSLKYAPGFVLNDNPNYGHLFIKKP